MELNFFINKIAEQFDETNIELFNENMEFKEIEEWSSLTVLSIIAMVDEEFGIRITGSDINNSNTIGDLFKLINSKNV